MAGRRTHRDRTAAGPFEPLLGGALVGGVFALAETAGLLGRYSTSPVSSQLTTLAVVWYVYAIAGLMFAAVCYGGRILAARSTGRSAAGAGRFWAGWFSLSCLVLISVRATTSGPFTASTGAWAVAAAAAVTALLAVAGPRLPWLRSVRFWGALNVVLLPAAAVWSTLAGPFDQGVSPLAPLAILPALGIAAAPMFRRGRGNRGPAVLTSLAAVSLVLVCLAVPAAWPSGRTPASGQTNLLLITVDTLRSDHVGCYGNDWIRTPNMDGLAEEGVLFENAVSPMPQTNPSHTTILTGLEPASHGVRFNRYILMKDGLTTLPEILCADGYRTAAFVSGSTLARPVCALWSRFQLYDDDFSSVPPIPDESMRYGVFRVVRRLMGNRGVVASISPDRRDGDAVSRAARRWIETSADEPFFLWVHLFDPHGPYDPPPPYDLMYDPSYAGSSDGNWYALSPEDQLEVIGDPREQQFFSARYAGEVSYADLQVGRLLETLRRMGLLERTLVVLTADHGESLTEHGFYFGHGEYLYEPSVSIPLVFRLPGGRNGGSRRPEVVTLADVQPTVLELLGSGHDEDTDGQSLARLCLSSGADGGIRPRVVYSALHRSESPDDRSLLAVRTPRYKYIRSSSCLEGGQTVPEAEELYDLYADPGETVDLAGREPALLTNLRASAEPYWQVWMGSDRGRPAALSDESREALRALGYVE